ncbi:hypothetical protein LTR17_021206 [Elasticomyces elasticus]|nr:hypothetical protein LTR17_021206 [Elasticomyces elasticus]
MSTVYKPLASKYLQYLSRDEAHEIIIQSDALPLRPGCQVMWSGVHRSWVQIWADERYLQTLTTAMGPLMDGKYPLYRRKSRDPEVWSKYVKGASALFAESLPKGDVVTVILRPPPHRLETLGSTTYQLLEQPVLKGESGGLAVLRIDVVHITVRGAENSAYQFWPVDEGQRWAQEHDASDIRKHLDNVARNGEGSYWFNREAGEGKDKGSGQGIEDEEGEKVVEGGKGGEGGEDGQGDKGEGGEEGGKGEEGEYSTEG